MRCGTILPLWTPTEWLTPPKGLRRDGKEGDLAKWYAERFRDYAYQIKGYGDDGSIRFRTPTDAGKVTNTPATEASGDYSAPMLPEDITDETDLHKTLTVPVDQRDHCQRIPYGTPAWGKAYDAGRNTVESVNSSLKAKHGLERENCQAMGLAPVTLYTLALVVIYNLGKTSHNLMKKRSSSGVHRRTSGSEPRPRSGSERRRAAQAATRAPP